MKAMNSLKNPDVVTINGEKFQVIENTSLFYNKENSELEMVVELVKIGENHITPNYRLVYIHENPEKVKFFRFDIKSEHWEEKTINSILL